VVQIVVVVVKLGYQKYENMKRIKNKQQCTVIISKQKHFWRSPWQNPNYATDCFYWYTFAMVTLL